MLADENTVYKLIGPVLVKQVPDRAAMWLRARPHMLTVMCLLVAHNTNIDPSVFGTLHDKSQQRLCWYSWRLLVLAPDQLVAAVDAVSIAMLHLVSLSHRSADSLRLTRGSRRSVLARPRGRH